jgi:hypothetical protein
MGQEPSLKMKKYLFLIVLFISCHNRKEASTERSSSSDYVQNCLELKEILLTDSISMKIPSTWKKMDLVKFHDIASIYSEMLMSNDSSNMVWIMIHNYYCNRFQASW